MELLKLIEELEDIIEEGSTLPFGSKVFIDKKHVLDIVKEIRLQLPDEIKQAEWINAERQRILAEAQQEADAIVENTKLYLQEQVENSQIVRQAQKQGEEIINQAQNTAKEIRLGSKGYADDMLKRVEENLHVLVNTVKENRQELNK